MEGRLEGRTSGWAIIGRRGLFELDGWIEELLLGPSSLRRRGRAVAAVILVVVMFVVVVASSAVVRLGLCGLWTVFGFNASLSGLLLLLLLLLRSTGGDGDLATRGGSGVDVESLGSGGERKLGSAHRRAYFTTGASRRPEHLVQTYAMPGGRKRGRTASVAWRAWCAHGGRVGGRGASLERVTSGLGSCGRRGSLGAGRATRSSPTIGSEVLAAQERAETCMAGETGDERCERGSFACDDDLAALTFKCGETRGRQEGVVLWHFAATARGVTCRD